MVSTAAGASSALAVEPAAVGAAGAGGTSLVSISSSGVSRSLARDRATSGGMTASTVEAFGAVSAIRTSAAETDSVSLGGVGFAWVATRARPVSDVDAVISLGGGRTLRTSAAAGEASRGAMTCAVASSDVVAAGCAVDGCTVFESPGCCNARGSGSTGHADSRGGSNASVSGDKGVLSAAATESVETGATMVADSPAPPVPRATDIVRPPDAALSASLLSDCQDKAANTAAWIRAAARNAAIHEKRKRGISVWRTRPTGEDSRLRPRAAAP